MPIINPDDIAAALPRRPDGTLDELLAGREALRDRERMLGSGCSFAIETTMSGNNPLRFMSEATQRGFKLTLVYVGIGSAALSLQRVRDRVAAGGHNVPVAAVMRRYPDTMSKLTTALAMAERAYIIDNSGLRRRLLVKIENGHATSVADNMSAWAVRAVPAKYQKREFSEGQRDQGEHLSFMQQKVDAARIYVAAGQGQGHDEVAAEFPKRAAQIARKS